MPDPRKPRLEPRLVIAAVLVAVPFLWLAAQVLLFRSGDECGDSDHSRVGDLVQMVVPGDGCEEGP